MKSRFTAHFAPPLLLVLLLALLAVQGCVRSLDPSPNGWSLYPMADGKYRIYEVIDTSYSLALLPQDADTVFGNTYYDLVIKRYYKKELSRQIETDLLDRPATVLDIYLAPWQDGGAIPADTSFVFEERWTQYRDEQYAERIEGNIKFRVLRFPLAPGIKWNGNAYNEQGDETFYYTNADTAMQVADTLLPGCVIVRQRLRGPILSEDVLTWEAYAPGVGKIERHDRYMIFDLESDPQSGSIIQTLSTVSYRYHERLVAHNYDLTATTTP